MTPPLLLAVPNVSEGRDAPDDRRDRRGVRGGGGRPRGGALLDVHADADHHRSVFTLAGRPAELADALLAGARAAVERVDVMGGAGGGRRRRSAERQHPYVGALDVAPLVYLRERDRGAACAEALVVADRIGEELEVPVFLYGELTADGGRRAGRAPSCAAAAPGRSRGGWRRGGGASACAGLRPGAQLHPSAGATLVAARAPLVAFNVRAGRAGERRATRVRSPRSCARAASEGLPGVRAIGVRAERRGVAQVSMNVERPLRDAARRGRRGGARARGDRERRARRPGSARGARGLSRGCRAAAASIPRAR